MYSAYQYTSIMDSMFQQRTSQLQSFYSREDYETLVDRYSKAKKDAKPFRKRDLEKLCAARGLDCGQLISNPSLLETIPTRQEMKEELLDIFFDLYSYAPNPSAYMERIVRRLAPEYNGDSVRVAILKKFILGGGTDFKKYDTRAIIKWAIEKMSPEEKRTYAASAGGEQLHMIVAQLDDSLFTPERLSVELTRMETLELMNWRWSRLDAEIQKAYDGGIFEKRDNRTLKQLREFCKRQQVNFCANDGVDELWMEIAEAINTLCKQHIISVNSPRDFITTLRCIIDGLLHQDLQEITDEQMEFVTACFWLLMRQTFYIDKSGKKATADSLFKTDVRDAKRKKAGKEWTLLRLCNDLAIGNFKTNNGNTRIHLYEFAMMFSMTLALKYTDSRDPDRDAVKNLFEDYYCDNMVRFMDDSYTDPKYSSTQEREPSGEGINLKNFAEAIYVFYLYRTDLNLTPGQRIDSAEKAIENCISRAKGKTNIEHPVRKRDYTSIYEQRMITRIIDADEKDLVDLIVANYYIDSKNNARITQASDTNTAFGIISETIAEIEQGSEYSGDAPPDYGNNEEAQQLARELTDDIKFTSINTFHWNLAPLLLERYGQNEGFARVVKNINHRLAFEADVIGIRRKNLLSNLLHTLYLQSSEECPIGLEALKEILHKEEAALTGDQICDCADLLKMLGFDVHRILEKKESCFYLGLREYKDNLLNQIIDRISVKYRYHENEEETERQKLFTQLLDMRDFGNRRVTRTMLIAVYTRSYISSIQDRYDLVSLPDLYDDFTMSINPVLVESRFQPFNEKNILDMYVLLSLYYYLIENGKGD